MTVLAVSAWAVVVIALVAVVVAGLLAIAAVRLLDLAKRQIASGRQRWRANELQRHVKAAPLRLTVATHDGRNTHIAVRPTSGDSLSRSAVEQLEQYVAGLKAGDIHRKLELEYRDGQWQERKPS